MPISRPKCFRYTKGSLAILTFLLACTGKLAAQTPATIWASTATPTTPDVGSDSPVELGVRFYSDTPGYVTGIRFYKSAANTGAHIGNLWSSSGTLLASATFTSETASGWQQVNFSGPVAITANTAYVASYHTTIGHYAGDASYFATTGVNNAPLHTYTNTSATPEAPYAYGSASQFPASTHNSANYWVDVAFSASASGGGGGTALKVGTASLPNASQSVAYSQALTASGGTSPYSWSVSSGTLPTGLSLSSSGTLSGTPTVAGAFPFTVAVKDAASASASASLSITVVTAAAPAVSISSPSNGATVSGTTTVSGVASDGLAITSVQLSVDGGAFANASGTTNWSFSLNTNSFSNGSHTLSAKVNNSAGNSATSSPVNITVNNGSTTATDCTLYASASGSDSNSGTSSSSPKTFQGAANSTQSGSVVCLLGGTYTLSSSFSPPTSGSPSSWITATSSNSIQCFDNYPGFHNIISNNIISGEVDQSTHHTDGNGIILDLSSGSYDPATANTPPALIINNVVYGNGGRCIVAYVVTNFWIVNNTCFKNDLDTSESAFGSFEPNDSHDGYLINNIAVAYTGGHPPYEQGGTVTNVHYYADLFFGAANNFSYSDPSQFLQADPLFLNPPSLSAGGYANALVPSLLSTGLTLLPLSPAYSRGIDPSTLSGLPANIVSDLKKYIYTDINGKARPQGGGVDLGAYQH